jgi:hypothetical protein
VHQGANGAGDDNSIETEKQAAERAGECGSHQVEVGSHLSFVLAVHPILHSRCDVSKLAEKNKYIELAGKSIDH